MPPRRALAALGVLFTASRALVPSAVRIRRSPRPLRETDFRLRSETDFRLAEDDAAPIELRDPRSAKSIACWPGCFVRFENGGPWYVVATPCDAPVAFAPSLEDDDDEAWVILQDDDPRMDAVFATAAAAVADELDDCAMVRSALFPTLKGDIDDQFDEADFEEGLDLDEDAGDDESVLSLIATFDVPELGHSFDMMRVEQVYQLIARKGAGDFYEILDEAESAKVRPKMTAALDEVNGFDPSGAKAPGDAGS